jgi:hypothetical protein
VSHTYLMRQPINAPLPPGEPERLEATLARFVACFANADGHLGLRFVPGGDGGPGDMEALDYVVYESLYGSIAADRSEFLETAAILFGNCLRRLLKLEWCITDLPSARVLAVCAPGETNGLTVPLEAMIAFRLSGGPQYNGFECLFCDIVASQPQWEPGTYFLEDASWMDAEALVEHWGFSVPDEIRARLRTLWSIDPERLLRHVGLAGFPCGGALDWLALSERLAVLEQELASTFGGEAMRDAARAAQQE